MDERKALACSSPEVSAFLEYIGAPKHITSFRIIGGVGDIVKVECSFYLSLPKSNEGGLIVTKRYKLVEFDDG